MRDLYVDGLFASFQQLVNRFSLPKRHFFTYLQVQYFVHNLLPDFLTLLNDSALDNFLEPLSSLGVISTIYCNIYNFSSGSLSALKNIWETDLGELVLDDVWEDILQRVHRSSI